MSLVDYVIIALLLLLAVRVYLRRNESEPPKWMGKLATANTMVCIQARLPALTPDADRRDHHGRRPVCTWRVTTTRLFYAVPFVLLTLLIVSIPLLVLLLLGHRAETILPKVRAWMTANSRIASEIVIAFFLILFL